MGTCTGPLTRCHGSVPPGSPPAEPLCGADGALRPGPLPARPKAPTLSNVTLPLSLLTVPVALPQQGLGSWVFSAMSLRPDRSHADVRGDGECAHLHRRTPRRVER